MIDPATLIKIEKIDVRLDALIALKEIEHADLKRMHRDNQDILKRIVSTLYGNEENNSPGIVQRVRDLESFFGIARWVVITGGGIVVVQVFQFGLDLFRGK